MRNLPKPELDPKDGLVAAGKGLHSSNPSHSAYHSNLSKLRTLFDDYTNHTSPCRLELLTSSFPSSDVHYQGLYDLYDSQRKFIKDFRKKVSEPNDRLIFCPLCNHSPAVDLDHYIPRSEMPEFSIHYYNLIPLCHQCNLEKHNLWLDDNGKRIFFNAYFDPAPDMADFLKCSISLEPNTNLPTVALSLLPFTVIDSESIRLAKSTTMKLNLINLYWQEKAEEALNEVRKQFENQRKASSPNLPLDEFYQNQIEVLKLDIQDCFPHQTIEVFVKKTIIDSEVFRQWVLTL